MTCAYCNEPAYIKCRKHRLHFCGTEYCTNLHRWGKGNCEFVHSEHVSWQQHCVRTLIALAVGCLVVWIVL